MVEHRTENPGVPGSIPGGTTTKNTNPCRLNNYKDLFFAVDVSDDVFGFSLEINWNPEDYLVQFGDLSLNF